jgi:integrase
MKRKQKRGRYGDGCIYRQKGRRIWWMTWYEDRRQPDGVTTREKCYESTDSEDRSFALRRLRSKLQMLGGRRPTTVDPRKVVYEDLRQNLLDYYVLKNRRTLKLKNGQPVLNTLARLDGFFGAWKASEIDITQLKRFRAEGKADGLSDARLNRYMACLRKMFNQAVRDELITRTEIPPYFPTTYEPNEAVNALFIEPQWYAPLRKELREPLRSAFTLAYHWSVRVGELERLRHRHIDVKNCVVNLSGDITKTGRPRSVPLPGDVVIKPGLPDALVFTLGDVRGQWQKACVKVGAGHFECKLCGARCDRRECPAHGKQPVKGVRYRGITLRHTRHTAARNMHDAGMDRQRIKDRTGHVTDAMLNRYNIGRLQDVDKARDLMERFHRRQAG